MPNSNSPIKLVATPEWELCKLTECTATPNGSVDDEGVELLFSIQIQFKSSDGSRRLVRRSYKMPIRSFTEELIFLKMILGKGRIPVSMFYENPGVLPFACEILLAGEHMACHRPPERTLLRLLACIVLFVNRMPNDDDVDIDWDPSKSDFVLNMGVSDRDYKTDDEDDDNNYDNNNNDYYVEVEEPVTENQDDTRNFSEFFEYINENGTGDTKDDDNNSDDSMEIDEPVTENQEDTRNFSELFEYINENGTGGTNDDYNSDDSIEIEELVTENQDDTRNFSEFFEYINENGTGGTNDTDYNSDDSIEIEEPVTENQDDTRNFSELFEYVNENGTGGTNDGDNNSDDYIEIEEPVTENQDDIINFFEHVEFIENGTGRFVPASYDSNENGTGFVDSNDNGIGFVPASEDSIRSLEKVRIKNDPGFDRECSVCLEELEVDSEATRLPCSHFFHGDCILKWLNISKFCPLCRYELPS